MAEWLKALAWKAGKRIKPFREFESHPLRHLVYEWLKYTDNFDLCRDFRPYFVRIILSIFLQLIYSRILIPNSPVAMPALRVAAEAST